MRRKISRIFWFIWGLPQNIVGLLMLTYFKITKKIDWVTSQKTSAVYKIKNSNSGAVSLGNFIFIFSDFHDMKETILHEYGHSIQSKILGPLYFIVIGLPSFVWAAAFDNYRRKKNISYYSFYPEKWANKLVGLDDYE